MRLHDLDGKRIALLGYGKEGHATLTCLARHAPRAHITICDKSEQINTSDLPLPCQVQLGPAWLDQLEHFDVLIKSPGIPPTPAIEAHRARIVSATQLFFTEAQAAGATIVGITGSKGKSTTTTLIYELLQAGGKQVYLVGNIGRPSLLELPHASKNTIFVHELSSYQLADSTIRPDVGVMTAFFPEHLDYHGSLEAYWEAKARIARFQTPADTFIFNADFPDVVRIAELSAGTHIGVTKHDCPVRLEEIQLRGTHNLGNIALAAAVADHFGIPREVQLPILCAFRGLPHRLQTIGVIGGITWVDDAISTTPDSAIAALEALGNDVHTIILGGQDRGVPYDGLVSRLCHSSVGTILLFPGAGERIRQLLSAAGYTGKMIDVASMAEAVSQARQHTPAGRTCLLSTAAASYGMFKNFEEKGDCFAAEIHAQHASPAA
jgi:UDP-N-acetylmuramoylalanine--D-glutamate ligase